MQNKRFHAQIIVDVMEGKAGKFSVKQVEHILSSKGHELGSTSVRFYLNTFAKEGLVDKEVKCTTRVFFIFKTDFTEKFNEYYSSYNKTKYKNFCDGNRNRPIKPKLKKAADKQEAILATKLSVIPIKAKKIIRRMIGTPGTTEKMIAIQ